MLKSLQQKPYICETTQKYVMVYLPGLLFFGFIDLERRFLTQFGLSHIPMYLQIGALIMCTIFMVISIHFFHFGVVGIALSHSVSNFILMLVMFKASAR